MTFGGEHQVMTRLGTMGLMYEDDKLQTAPVICLVHVLEYAEGPLLEAPIPHHRPVVPTG